MQFDRIFWTIWSVDQESFDLTGFFYNLVGFNVNDISSNHIILQFVRIFWTFFCGKGGKLVGRSVLV